MECGFVVTIHSERIYPVFSPHSLKFVPPPLCVGPFSGALTVEYMQLLTFVGPLYSNTQLSNELQGFK